MRYSWVYINRNSAMIRLIVPGWSILPGYFARLFPNDNLIILNPFIINHHQLVSYCEHELANENIKIINQTIDEIMNQNVNCIFIFSMGLQWVSEHAAHWLNMNCEISSPSVCYDFWELNNMVKHLKSSKQAVLRSFYRRCFHSNEDWSNWRQTELEPHLKYNDANNLIEWLEQYGQKRVEIPNKDSITVWMDPMDPIGEKPAFTYDNINIRLIKHNRGHFFERLV